MQTPKAELTASLALLLLTACAPAPAPPLRLTPAWQAVGSDPAGKFGTRAMSAGDVNGDGYDDLMVGAPQWQRGRGQASLYLGSARGLAAQAAWTRAGESDGELWADRVGQAGDLNGDGFDDVFVAAPGWRNGLGRCAVFYGSARGLRQAPDWSATPSNLGELFGDCTHPTGDLDGDGFDDLAVGSYGFDSNRGRALLYRGGKQGLGAAPVWESQGAAQHDWYGYGIGTAGDVNGDGYGDLLLGAKYNDEAGTDAGKAYLHLGGPSGLRAAPDWSHRGPQAGANHSVRVSGVGDLDADGFDDVMVTAPGVDGRLGEVALFFGGPRGLKSRPKQRLRGARWNLDFFGQGACPAGDMDGDGYDDLAVHGRDSDGRGQALIFRGGPKGLSPDPAWLVKGEGIGDRFAWWLAPAGDVDGDGLSDLVISAETRGPGQVSVLLGRQCREALGAAASPLKLRSHPQKGYLKKKR